MRLQDLIDIWRLPHVQINLMLEQTVNNEPFYAQAVKNFYRDASAPHPKLLFAAGRYQYGYAVCRLHEKFDEYFMKIDASARRNCKKAARLGYTFKRFNYNDCLEDIRDIWLSTPVRQGLVPKNMREGRVTPISDPPSKNHDQDYPYFGVFKDERLVAYVGCLVTGQLCSLNEMFGHDGYLEDGVVPLAIVETARLMIESYPQVQYYGYGTYFGASNSMRRFKRKFLFLPHRVTWLLKSPSVAGVRPINQQEEAPHDHLSLRSD
jgi:hypothetical protein